MTQVPSIKEVLEDLVRAVSNMRVPQNVAEAALQVNVTIGPVLERAKDALATLRPDGERREAIAPLRTRLADLIHQNYEPAPEGFPETEPWNGGALDIVDMIIEEILASGLVQENKK